MYNYLFILYASFDYTSSVSISISLFLPAPPSLSPSDPFYTTTSLRTFIRFSPTPTHVCTPSTCIYPRTSPVETNIFFSMSIHPDTPLPRTLSRQDKQDKKVTSSFESTIDSYSSPPHSLLVSSSSPSEDPVTLLTYPNPLYITVHRVYRVNSEFSFVRLLVQEVPFASEVLPLFNTFPIFCVPKNFRILPLQEWSTPSITNSEGGSNLSQFRRK